MLHYSAAALALVAFAGSCHGQTTFLAGPEEAWKTDFSKMGQGNGIVVAPDNSLLYATAEDGTLGALNPVDGSKAWSYKPTTDSTFLNGNGQASVAMDGSYVVYAVTENMNLPQESCKVVALAHPSGDVLWTSPALDGACQGTPHISSSGKYIYVTHNSDSFTVGHFSVLINDQDGAVLVSKSDSSGPFSAPGIYHSPTEGNFAQGRGNTQDLLMWSNAPDLTATTGQGGSMFAFQLPFNYAQAMGTDSLEITTVSTVGWRSTSPPRLAADGLQLFWSVSRGQFRSWVDTRFSASASGSAEFTRGSPLFLAPQNTPAIDDDASPTKVCAGTASTMFVCMDAADMDTGAIWSLDLAGFVLSNPLFSTEGDRVYFAEDRGVFLSVNPETGDKYFEKSTGAPVHSNFVLSEDGAYLYFGDKIGNVVAWKVAEEAVTPTPAPTPAPTMEEPSAAPSGEAQDTSVPTLLPTTASPPTGRVDEPTAPSPTAAPPTNAPPATSGASRVAVASAMLVGAVGALLL